METNKRPLTILSVEADLRAMVPPAVAAQLDSEYPFLFGMATVKLAEANREIARLLKLTAEMNTERSCEMCGHDWRGSKECPVCGYDGQDDEPTHPNDIGDWRKDCAAVNAEQARRGR